MGKKSDKPKKPAPDEKPVSLKPLKVEEALKGLLRTSQGSKKGRKSRA